MSGQSYVRLKDDLWLNQHGCIIILLRCQMLNKITGSPHGVRQFKVGGMYVCMKFMWNITEMDNVV